MSKALDPVTGPLSREELAALAAAPAGVAAEKIREHDPFWGRGDGEKIRWKVTGRSNAKVEAYVMAASQEEANELADKLGDAEFDEVGWGDIEIDSIEPDRRSK